MNQDKVGYLRLTYKDLKEILDLPEGVEIVGVGSGALVHEFNAIHITLSSPKFPNVPEGGPVPRVRWEQIESCRSSQETTSSPQSAS